MFIPEGNQYWVHALRALMHARHLLGMLDIMPRVISLGIHRHSSSNARPSCCKLLQRWAMVCTLRHNTSQMCSIGDISGDLACQGSQSYTLLSQKVDGTTGSVWARVFVLELKVSTNALGKWNNHLT